MISKLLSQYLESIKIKDSDTDVKAQRQEHKAPLSETGEIVNYRKLFVLKL